MASNAATEREIALGHAGGRDEARPAARAEETQVVIIGKHKRSMSATGFPAGAWTS
jgi:hypothetical protein